MASIPPPPPPPPPPPDFSVAPPPPAQTAPPAPAANAAVESQPSTTEDGKSWDKPWKPSVVKQKAKEWSLAGDSALLLYLKQMSEDVISRTHSLGKDIDELTASIKTCEVSANNAFNEFITLANSQFIENRVYDEDVSQAAADENPLAENQKEKSKQELESELIPKISEAVKLGLNVLETAYEKLEVNVDDGDSDDDEPYQGDPMLEVKDPYVLRSLPVLIGSQAFYQNDNVGLVDLPSEDELSDHGSISESEEESPDAAESSEYSYSDSDDDEDAIVNRKQPVPAAKAYSSSESEEDDDDMFGTSSKPPKLSSDESEDAEAAAVAEPRDFTSELAKKIGMPAAPSQGGEDTKPQQKNKTTESKSSSQAKAHKEKKSKKTKNQKLAFDDDDMFGAADSDDDDGLFSSKGGLFDSGGGLFDNKTSQDDGGLFDDVADMDSSHLKSSRKTFSSSDESEESERGQVKAPSKAKQSPALAKQSPALAKQSPVTHDLFGDSDEDDMFAQPSKSKPAASVLDDEEDDEFLKPKEAARVRTASGRKVPAGAVSMFGGTGGGNPLAAALSKRRQSSTADEETDEDISDLTSKQSTAIEPSAKQTTTREPAKAAGGLFSSTDSDGDDLFGGSQPAKVEPKLATATPETKKKMPAGAVSMFGGSGNPLAAALKQRAGSKMSAEEEGWSDEEPSKPAPVKEEPRKAAAAPASSGLFSEEDEDDLFGSKQEVASSGNAKKPAGGVSLFGGVDPFGAQKSNTLQKESAKPSAASKTSGKSLFSDSDDDDGLFSGKPPATTASKPPPTKQQPSKGLFSESDSGDEPASAPNSKPPPKVAAVQQKKSLFSDSDDGDDMFSTKVKAKVAQPAKAASTNQPAKAAPPPKKDLFDDSDDDDLFSTKVKAVSAEPPKAASASQPAVKAAQPPKKDLFDDSDDDGGMFSAASKAPAAVQPPPSVQPKSKGLFSESDDEEVAVPPRAASKPSVVAQTTSKSSTAPGLFSDSDDDLFSGKNEPKANKVNVKDTTKPTNQTAVADSPLGGVKSVQAPSKPASSLFASGSDDDDMFGSNASGVGKSSAVSVAVENPSPRVEDIKPVEPEKPRKPAGAVPMFGGMDPTALLKNKSAASAPTAKAARPIRKAVPASTLFDSDSSDDDLFSSTNKSARKPPPRKKVEPKEVVKPTSQAQNMSVEADPLQTAPATAAPATAAPAKVSSESAADASNASSAKKMAPKFGINPLAMLPGATPPKKEPEPQAVGFDIPAENTKVLHSMNKSRAKVQHKRKPPSRFIRGPSAQPVVSSPEVHNQPNDRVPAMDSLPATSDSTHMTTTASTTKSFLEDSDSDDLFGSKPKPAPSPEPAANVPASSPPRETIKSNPLSSPPPQSKPAPSLDPFADSDDDLFSKPSSAQIKKKVESPLNGDTTDTARNTSTKIVRKLSSPDMEGPPPLSSVSEEPSNKNKDPFSLDDSDDDIFSTKKSSKSKKPVTDIFDDELFSAPAKKKTILDDIDDDDLFATAKPAKSKRQKATTKDKDIFGDDDDIFADIKVTSKPKKSQTGTSKSKAKKGVFDDDMDDLFADLGTAKKTKKKVDLDDDIFGDPLGGLK